MSLKPSYVQQSTCLGRLKTNYLSGFVYRAESLQEHCWAETPGQWSFWFSVHLCVVLLKVQPPGLSTHHFLLLSLPLLLDLFSQFVQLIFSGQERLERNTENPHHTHHTHKAVRPLVSIIQPKKKLDSINAAVTCMNLLLWSIAAVWRISWLYSMSFLKAVM